jgi:hypothetical protein
MCEKKPEERNDVNRANPIIATIILCARQCLWLTGHTGTGLLNVLKECDYFLFTVML